MPKTKIHHSTGNVFADLKIAEPDQYLTKAKLAAKILKIVQTRKLTQIKTGKLLGLGQPKVSALLNGRLVGFANEQIIKLLHSIS